MRAELTRRVYLSLFVVIFAPLYIYTFDPKLDLNGDNAKYYVLGKALSLGRGYVNIHTREQSPAQSVPPGYPVLISAVMGLASRDFVAIKIANGVFFFLMVIALFFLFERLSGNIHLAFVAGLLVLLNGHLLRYATVMMSEIPFLLFSTLALYFFARITPAKDSLKNPYFYLFSVSLIFSFYVRTAGIALLGGALLYFLLDRNWKSLLTVATGYGLFVLPWIFRERALGGESYLNVVLQINPYEPEAGQAGIGDILGRLLSNAKRYTAEEIPNGFLNFIDAERQLGWADWLAGVVILLVIGYGIFRLKSHRSLMTGYLAGAFGILLLWPESWFGIRFLLPILPLLLFCFLHGLYDLLCRGWARLPVKRRPSPLFFLAFALISFPHLEHVHAIGTRGRYPKSWQNYVEVARWVKHNTEKDAIVCCRKPLMFYLWADRYATSYKNTLDDQELIAELRAKEVDYVVLDNLGYSSARRYLLPAVQKNADQFTRILRLEDPDTWLLEF